MNLEEFNKVKDKLVTALEENPYKARNAMRLTETNGTEHRCCLCVIQDALCESKEQAISYTLAENENFSKESSAFHIFHDVIPDFPVCKFSDYGNYEIRYLSATLLNDDYDLTHKHIANCVANIGIAEDKMLWKYILDETGKESILNEPMTLEEINEKILKDLDGD